MQQVLIYLKHSLVAIGVYLVAFFSPIAPYLVAVGFLVAMDFRTGVKAAKKEKIAITSDGFKQTCLKYKDYGLLIIVAHILSTIFFKDSPAIVPAAGSWIALTEVKSLCENMYKITGNDMWNKLLTFLPDVGTITNKKFGRKP